VWSGWSSNTAPVSYTHTTDQGVVTHPWRRAPLTRPRRASQTQSTQGSAQNRRSFHLGRWKRPRAACALRRSGHTPVHRPPRRGDSLRFCRRDGVAPILDTLHRAQGIAPCERRTLFRCANVASLTWHQRLPRNPPTEPSLAVPLAATGSFQAALAYPSIGLLRTHPQKPLPIRPTLSLPIDTHFPIEIRPIPDVDAVLLPDQVYFFAEPRLLA